MKRLLVYGWEWSPLESVHTVIVVRNNNSHILYRFAIIPAFLVLNRIMWYYWEILALEKIANLKLIELNLSYYFSHKSEVLYYI